jgi:hypothetical protein
LPLTSDSNNVRRNADLRFSASICAGCAARQGENPVDLDEALVNVSEEMLTSGYLRRFVLAARRAKVRIQLILMRLW